MANIQSLLRLFAEHVVNSRNGYRGRSLETCVGTRNLRIHKLRTGSIFPEDALERYQRVDRPLVAAMTEMYSTGTSTRKPQKIAAEMSIERFGRDRASAIVASFDAKVADLAEEPLDEHAIPCIWLDATYVK